MANCRLTAIAINCNQLQSRSQKLNPEPALPLVLTKGSQPLGTRLLHSYPDIPRSDTIEGNVRERKLWKQTLPKTPGDGG